jgi:hypothetical protein
MHGLALCRVDCPEGRWTATRAFHGLEARLMDITFCNGELYGLTDSLVKFEIGVDEHDAPVLTAVHRLVVPTLTNVLSAYGFDPDFYARYIIDLRGKLVMVIRQYSLRRRKYFFRVLELVDVDSDKYMWATMASLGDHALFFGWTCSKAVHVPEGERGGVKRNHIYYSHDRCLRRDDIMLLSTSSIHDSGRLYYKEEYNGVERIATVEYYVKGGPCPPIWILPPDI